MHVGIAEGGATNGSEEERSGEVRMLCTRDHKGYLHDQRDHA